MKRSRLFIAIGSILLITIGAVAAVLILRSLPASAPPRVTGADTMATQPKLTVERVIDGLDHPWEVAYLPDQTVLFTERNGTISKLTDGKKVELLTPSDAVARGEGGMLGLAVDPDFSSNGYVYACFNSDRSVDADVRVARFTLSEDRSALEDRKDIVTGMPANPSGRHSGCRIAFGPDKNLWIGTGDAADEDEAQDTRTLGGKILRVDREGQGVTGNITDGDERIYSYGHRNTQGLAFYEQIQAGSYGISVEHGTARDDEINPLAPGNFGWQPGDGYDESADMTDSIRFPSAVKSLWSSGSSTVAVSGADFLRGDKWKNWQGKLMVAVLKNQQIKLFTLKDGQVVGEEQLYENQYGRIRTIRLAADQSIYFTTDNGTNDGIYRITPS